MEDCKLLLDRISLTVLLNKAHLCVTWRVFEDVCGKKKKRGIYRRKIRILFQIISTSLIMEYLNFLIPIKLLNWVSKIQPDDLCKLPYHPPMVLLTQMTIQLRSLYIYRSRSLRKDVQAYGILFNFGNYASLFPKGAVVLLKGSPTFYL